MQDSLGHHVKGVLDNLNQIRQQLKAWQEQQEVMEQRLQVFRQRQQDLQAQLEILHVEQQYHKMLRQEQERKQAE